MVLKTLKTSNAGQWSWKIRNTEVGLEVASILHWESLQAILQGGAWGEAGELSELKDRADSWLRKDRTLKRRDMHSNRTMKTCRSSPRRIKNYEEHIPLSQRGINIICFHQPVNNLIIHKTLNRVLRRVCLRTCGMMSPKQNTDLVPRNKS